MTEATINVSGTELHTRTYPTPSPIARIILVHGYAEHSGRYAWVCEQLNAANIAVYAYDHLGHGKSSGRKAYVTNFDTYVDHLEAMVQRWTADVDVPVFLLGHSMGGLVIAKYLVDRQVDHIAGIVLSAPALKADPDLSPFLQKISPIAGRLLPKLKTVTLDGAYISRIPEEVATYQADPLIYHQGTYASTGYQMLRSMNYVQQHFDRWSLPTLILHGTADKLADPTASQMLYDQMSSTDKTLHLLPGLYHEITREPEKHKVMETITQWITERS